MADYHILTSLSIINYLKIAKYFPNEYFRIAPMKNLQRTTLLNSPSIGVCEAGIENTEPP